MFIEVSYYHSAKSSISGSQNLMYTTIIYCIQKVWDKGLQQKAMNWVYGVAEKKIGNSKWQPHLNNSQKLAKKGLNLALYKTKTFLKY